MGMRINLRCKGGFFHRRNRFCCIAGGKGAVIISWKALAEVGIYICTSSSRTAIFPTWIWLACARENNTKERLQEKMKQKGKRHTSTGGIYCQTSSLIWIYLALGIIFTESTKVPWNTVGIVSTIATVCANKALRKVKEQRKR